MLLATGAHLVGGGHLPSAGVLLVATFLVGLTAVTTTARRCPPGLLVAVLGVQQIVLHEVFEAMSMAPATCAASPIGDHGTAMTGCLGAMHGSGSGVGMLTAHLVATLATAWLLARGERWLWKLSEQAVHATTWAPTRRVRRPRPLRPLPAPAVTAAQRPTTADPRGPPVLASVRLNCPLALPV